MIMIIYHQLFRFLINPLFYSSTPPIFVFKTSSYLTLTLLIQSNAQKDGKKKSARVEPSPLFPPKNNRPQILYISSP